jgi:methionine aminopeptidase
MESVKYYKQGKDICLNVYTQLKQVIQENKLGDLSEISKLGNDLLKDALSSKGSVFIPISINLNDCISFYVDELVNQEIRKEYSVVRVGDVVKIEMGVVIEGCILHFGETFIASGGKERREWNTETDTNKNANILKKLNDIPKRLCKKVYPELDDSNDIRLVNDDISNFVTSECTKFDCYPVTNTISYKGTIDSYENQDEKIILGFKPKYDETDEWIILDNPCYDIQNGDVFNLNITIVPERETNYVHNGKVYKQNEHIYTEPHPPHLYRFTGETLKFNLKSVREFINAVKTKYLRNFFNKNFM